MKIIKKIMVALGLLYVSISFYGCSDSWDDHTAVTDQNLNENLYQKISEDAALSEFTKLLERSGYDEILSSSKTFTVWAPNNEAMSQMNSNLDDPQELEHFMDNHITISSFSTDMVLDTIRVRMLTGKYLDFIPGPSMAGADLTVTDQYASNGIYHIIDKDLAPQPNLWEFITSNTGDYDQNNFIVSLNDYDLFDSEDEVQEGVEVVDSVINEILRTGYDLKDEEKRFTYFLMTDSGFEQEKEKLLPYSLRPSRSATENLAQYYVVRDMIFEGVYDLEHLPDTLTSVYGVKVPIDKSEIIGDPIALSNGIAYTVDVMDVSLENRLLPTIVEGENPIGFSQNDKRGNTYYRERIDPSGVEFEDIMVQNHEVPLFEINYNAPNLYSTTYKVYWRAVNDIQENVFQQRLRIGGQVQEEDGMVTNPIALFPYIDVELNNYEEVFVGEFTLDFAGDLNPISLIAANSGSLGVNTLTLDYLKLVPVVE